MSKMKFLFLTILLMVYLSGCTTLTKPPTHGITSDNGLFVFVGKKVGFRKATKDEYIRNFFRDHMYIATYEVIQPIFGSFDKPVIEFMAFDHYGKPWFSDFEYVMLPVSEYVEGIVQEKYLFFDVYPTSTGRWATCGNSVNEIEKFAEIAKLQRIEFSPELIFPYLTYEGADPLRDYPEPIYAHKEGFAVCKLGVYTEDLFQYQKEGVLTARGFFDKNR